MRFSLRKTGKAVEDKANKKSLKYRLLINQNYFFVPFPVKTVGPWSDEATQFFNILTKKIARKTYELRTRSFLQQRISMAIQRGNVSAVMSTFRSNFQFGFSTIATLPQFPNLQFALLSLYVGFASISKIDAP